MLFEQSSSLTLKFAEIVLRGWLGGRSGGRPFKHRLQSPGAATHRMPSARLAAAKGNEALGLPAITGLCSCWAS